MNNLEYLEKIKKADEDLKLNFKNLVRNEEGDSYRQVKALEIVAEEFCKYNIHLKEFKKQLDEANQLTKNVEI